MKLADMPDLGSGAFGVQVQVLSSAPRFKNSLEALMPKGVLFNYLCAFRGSHNPGAVFQEQRHERYSPTVFRYALGFTFGRSTVARRIFEPFGYMQYFQILSCIHVLIYFLSASYSSLMNRSTVMCRSYLSRSSASCFIMGDA